MSRSCGQDSLFLSFSLPPSPSLSPSSFLLRTTLFFSLLIQSSQVQIHEPAVRHDERVSGDVVCPGFARVTPSLSLSLPLWSCAQCSGRLGFTCRIHTHSSSSFRFHAMIYRRLLYMIIYCTIESARLLVAPPLANLGVHLFCTYGLFVQEVVRKRPTGFEVTNLNWVGTKL